MKAPSLPKGPLWWYSTNLKVPIRFKLLLPILGLVIGFGMVHVLVLNRVVFRSLEDEYVRNGTIAARLLSEGLEQALLFDDDNRLVTALWDWKNLDPGHAYAFVVDHRGVLKASTFNKGMPKGLQQANPPGDDPEIRVQRLLDRDSPLIDIAVPLVDAGAGWLHLGFHEAPVLIPARKVVWLALGMVGVFIILGLVGALVLSRLFTAPIGVLLERTADVNLDGPPVRLDMRTGDEWQVLASAFERMTDRLQENHRELALAIRRASESERMASLGLLAAGVAHEISNPIAGIEMGLKRIGKRPGDTGQLERYLPNLLASTGHVLQIVREMLAYARPETPAPVALDPRDLVNQSLLLLAHRLEEGRITLSQHHEPPGSRLVADRRQVEQVLVNLLGNALDAMPDGGSLVVASRLCPNGLELRVSDTGCGIEANALERIWEPFYTTKPVGRGTGLGLAVTRTLVERHDGTIRVESRQGHGTTFILTFPAENPR